MRPNQDSSKMAIQFGNPARAMLFYDQVKLTWNGTFYLFSASLVKTRGEEPSSDQKSKGQEDDKQQI